MPQLNTAHKPTAEQDHIAFQFDHLSDATSNLLFATLNSACMEQSIPQSQLKYSQALLIIVVVHIKKLL